jgi:hypothetical protein
VAWVIPFFRCRGDETSPFTTLDALRSCTCQGLVSGCQGPVRMEVGGGVYGGVEVGAGVSIKKISWLHL